jgi:lipopolysaccharide export LptBFGC system permease protein LptF
MRVLLCIILLSAIANFANAQQTTPQSNSEIKKLKEQQAPIKQSSRTPIQQVAIQPTPTKSSEADIRAKQLAGLEKNGVNVQAYNYLGLDPFTATPEEYSAAKEKLYHEEPEKWTEFKALVQSEQVKTGKQTITRSNYNALPANRKANIDSNPQLYQIID